MSNRTIDLPLGALELEVMEHLWAQGSADVRSAHEALSALRPRQLNTLQSTLDRLFRKGVLAREKISRAYRYTPKLDREALLLSSMHTIAEQLGDIDRGALLASFLELDGEDDATLDRLQAVIDVHRHRDRT